MSTEIIIVLDRSGSMQAIAEDMCGGFDAFIEDQKKVPGECRVTLTQFDTTYEIVYAGKPLEEVPPLELVPRGMTAMLDAVGRTIDETGQRLAAMPEADRPKQVLFVIITDGKENASVEYTQAGVLERITHQREKYSWEFVFMGASQDAFQQALELGISTHNTVSYKASAGVGAASVMGSVSRSVSTYRTGQGLGDIQATYDSLTTKT